MGWIWAKLFTALQHQNRVRAVAVFLLGEKLTHHFPTSLWSHPSGSAEVTNPQKPRAFHFLFSLEGEWVDRWMYQKSLGKPEEDGEYNFKTSARDVLLTSLRCFRREHQSFCYCSKGWVVFKQTYCPLAWGELQCTKHIVRNHHFY